MDELEIAVHAPNKQKNYNFNFYYQLFIIIIISFANEYIHENKNEQILNTE